MSDSDNRSMFTFRYPAIILALLASQPVSASEQCTYSTYKWNVHQRQAVETGTIKKPYSKLTEHEVDAATGCTVCEEDQVEITLPDIEPFKLCRHIAFQVEHALRTQLKAQAPIHKIVGYRVGMTRGDVDEHGNRTRFSNHSFGIALDINPESNGLYENCLQFGPQCRLRKGGIWDPDQPDSLTADGPVVTTLKEIGLRWGGEIEGRQKDFMHFSPSGY